MHAQKDQEKKLLIDARNAADSTIYSVEKSLSEYKDKLPSEVVSEIEFVVADLKKEITNEDVEDEEKKWDDYCKS